MIANDKIQPSITFMNMTGDITISWDDTNRDQMLALVQQKMNEGYSFFIVEPRLFGMLGTKKVEVTSIEQARKAGAVSVKDKDVQEILKRAKLDDPAVEAAVSSGAAKLVSAGHGDNISTTRRARSASEVVSNQTVAVRRVVGG